MKTLQEVYEKAKSSTEELDSALVDKTATQDVYFKQFDENAQTGPTLRDFERRVESIRDAIIWRLRNPNEQFKAIIQEEGLDVEKQIKLIEKAADDAKARLAKHTFKQYDVMHLKEDAVEKEIKSLVAACKDDIALFNVTAGVLVSPKFKKNVETNQLTGEFFSLLQQFRRAENDYIVENKKRLDIVTEYKIPDVRDTRVSIQRTIGETLPCTERFGGDKDNPLSNFVESGIGYVRNGAYQQQFKGYRHSSLPAIFSGSDFKREQFATLSVKKMMEEMVLQDAGKTTLGTRADPHVVELSSLALLTPLTSSDLVISSNEKERKQLIESYQAVMLYNNRTIQMEIDGRTQYVTLKANFMNTGLNPMGATYSRLPEQNDLERSINAKGMVKFIEDTRDYFEKKHIFMPYFPNKSQYRAQFREIERLKDNIKSVQERLELCYDADTSSQEYLDAKREFQNLLTREEALYQTIFNGYQSQIQENRALIEQHRNRLTQNRQGSNETDALIEQAFLDGMLLYLDGEVQAPEFGARYLLVNEGIGRSVDWYCKSGKDRTGMMNSLLESMCIHVKENGYYPYYDSDQKCIDVIDKNNQNNILRYVGERSISRPMADANIPGAKGLQLEYKAPIVSWIKSDVNQYVSNVDQGPGLGKIAKGVFDKGTIKKLDKSGKKEALDSIKASVVVEKRKEATGILKQDAFDFEISVQKKGTKSSSTPPVVDPSISQITGTSDQIVIQGVHLDSDEEVKLTKHSKGECVELVYDQKATILLSDPKDDALKAEYWLESWLTRLRSGNVEHLTLCAKTKEDANIGYAAFLLLKQVHPQGDKLVIEAFKGVSPDFPHIADSKKKYKVSVQKHIEKHLKCDPKLRQKYQDNLEMHHKTMAKTQSWGDTFKKSISFKKDLKKMHDEPSFSAGMNVTKLQK